MVEPAQRHSELVAYFTSHGALLSELKMVCIRGAATAGEAGLGAHELQMMPVAKPKWFANRGDELRRSLRSRADDGCILLRCAALRHPIAVELCRNWFAVETGVAVCNSWLAVAVGLGFRTHLGRIESCTTIVAEFVELCGKSSLDLLRIRCGELVFESQNPFVPTSSKRRIL
jgi:hypothetical protein